MMQHGLRSCEHREIVPVLPSPAAAQNGTFTLAMKRDAKGVWRQMRDGRVVIAGILREMCL